MIGDEIWKPVTCFMSSYRQTKTLSEGIETLTDTFKPQMTLLIDILTLLLVFLIQSFNAEGTLVT